MRKILVLLSMLVSMTSFAGMTESKTYKLQKAVDKHNYLVINSASFLTDTKEKLSLYCVFVPMSLSAELWVAVQNTPETPNNYLAVLPLDSYSVCKKEINSIREEVVSGISSSLILSNSQKKYFRSIERSN